jgi:hypothetical protein
MVEGSHSRGRLAEWLYMGGAISGNIDISAFNRKEEACQ